MLKVLLLALCMIGMLQPAHAQEKEGGIIGTGVLGQVTALGSIYVNGLHITFSPDIVLEGAQDVKDLLPGMTVAVSVQNDNGAWIAHSIRRVSSLVGPVTGPSEVMGVRVVGRDLPLKSWVRLDGHWSESGFEATYVEQVAQGVVSITGPLSDEHNVGGLEFTGITPLHAEIGDPITVWGDFVDGKIVANQIRNGLFVGSEPALVLAQGFLSEPTTGGEYTLIGSGAVAYTTQPQMIDVSQLVVRCIFEGSLDFQSDEPLAFGTEIIPEFCPD